MAIFGGVASLLAPSSVVLFTNIDFHLFGMHVNKYNFIGIFISVVTILYTIGIYLIFVNKIKKKKKTNLENLSTKKAIINPKSIFTANVSLVMLAEFMCGVANAIVEPNINLVGMFVFEWSLSMLSIASLICAVMTVTFMKFIQRYNGIINIFFILVMSVVILNIIICLQLVAIHAKFKTKFIQVAIITISYFSNAVSSFNTTPWARYILFLLVPSQIASTIDGYRFFFFIVLDISLDSLWSHLSSMMDSLDFLGQALRV